MQKKIFFSLICLLSFVITTTTVAIPLQPSPSSDPYIRRAKLLIEQKKYNSAIMELNNAIRLYPSYEAYYNRGLVWDTIHNWSNALADYTMAVGMNSTYADAYYHRGIVRMKMGDYINATADFTVVIKINPNFSQAYQKRAQAYQKLGNNIAAEEDIKIFNSLH